MNAFYNAGQVGTFPKAASDSSGFVQVKALNTWVCPAVRQNLLDKPEGAVFRPAATVTRLLVPPIPDLLEVFIGNLDSSVDAVDLWRCFHLYGNCQQARIIADHSTGQSRGFGFVAFSCESSVHMAVNELHGCLFFGRILRVEEAFDKNRRRALTSSYFNTIL
ncbi:hypothetical protein PBRA_002264 [Plasmodiophora brassicae]|nr:hypothetical protein PBRA_002264 [Plasmodiophora brassicae]